MNDTVLRAHTVRMIIGTCHPAASLVPDSSPDALPSLPCQHGVPCYGLQHRLRPFAFAWSGGIPLVAMAFFFLR